MEVGNRHPPPGSGCSLSTGALAALGTRCSALPPALHAASDAVAPVAQPLATMPVPARFFSACPVAPAQGRRRRCPRHPRACGWPAACPPSPAAWRCSSTEPPGPQSAGGRRQSPTQTEFAAGLGSVAPGQLQLPFKPSASWGCFGHCNCTFWGAFWGARQRNHLGHSLQVGGGSRQLKQSLLQG